MRFAAMAMLAVALAGCGLTSRPPKPAVLDLAISAGADQNPESDGHPAPVGIKLFQLGGTGAFERADVFALMNDASSLGADLLASETVSVNPGQTLRVHRLLKPGAQFLGVAVLFRDIDHATWRATAPLAPNGPTRLKLATARLTMTLAP